jgi:hypothetical protein
MILPEETDVREPLLVSGFGQGLASSGLSLVNGKRLMLLLEQSGATENASGVRMLLKNMVGPWGLEPQTSTVSSNTHRFYNDLQDRGDCQSTRKSYKPRAKREQATALLSRRHSAMIRQSVERTPLHVR